MTTYIDIEELSGAQYSTFEVDQIMKKKGLRLVAIRIERPEADSDGAFTDVAFTDVAHYLLGKPMIEPTPTAESE